MCFWQLGVNENEELFFAARGGHFGLTIWNFLKGKNPYKCKRNPGSMIKVSGTPGTIKIQHNINRIDAKTTVFVWKCTNRNQLHGNQRSMNNTFSSLIEY